MLSSALTLLASAALAAAAPLTSKDPEVICKTPGACLTITQFDAIAPLHPQVGDQTSIVFTINSDVPSFSGSSACGAEWAYPNQGWPWEKRVSCKNNAFSFKFNNFVDVDQPFQIEATYLYHDPKVAGPTPPPKGVRPMDTVTNFAAATVRSEDVDCKQIGTAYKYCQLKDKAEILLVIDRRTA